MTRSLGRLVSIAIVSYFSVEIIDYVEGPKRFSREQTIVHKVH
jgi:hypothetical protein